MPCLTLSILGLLGWRLFYSLGEVVLIMPRLAKPFVPFTSEATRSAPRRFPRFRGWLVPAQTDFDCLPCPRSGQLCQHACDGIVIKGGKWTARPRTAACNWHCVHVCRCQPVALVKLEAGLAAHHLNSLAAGDWPGFDKGGGWLHSQFPSCDCTEYRVYSAMEKLRNIVWRSGESCSAHCLKDLKVVVGCIHQLVRHRLFTHSPLCRDCAASCTP